MVYDVFISFKNSDENGNATKDSAIAQKLYDYLSGKGLRVFFSNVELEFLGKAQYTEVIDDALDSSRFLIAVGCSRDNLSSQWVRYEWSGFLNDIRSNIKPNAEVFVLYADMTIGELPRALRQQQAFDAGDGDAMEKLYRFIKNAMRIKEDSRAEEKLPAPANAASNGVAVGDTIKFGPYDWRVLDVQDGKALLTTKDVIEQKVFNDKPDNTWATCTLRGWLNSEFLGKFSERERGAIDGEIFLLSAEEARKYFSSDSDRAAKFNSGGSWWWLRSPGSLQNYAALIYAGGTVDGLGLDVDNNRGGIRPAMWVTLD